MLYFVSNRRNIRYLAKTDQADPEYNRSSERERYHEDPEKKRSAKRQRYRESSESARLAKRVRYGKATRTL